MLGASTHPGINFSTRHGMAERAASHRRTGSQHVDCLRMSAFVQPPCDRKLLVSCSSQHLRQYVPMTNLATFNPAISSSSLTGTQRKGISCPRGRKQQLVQCRATKQEVAKRQQQHQQHHQQTLEVQPAESSVRVPILSGGGGGIFFWWEIGEHCSRLSKG